MTAPFVILYNHFVGAADKVQAALDQIPEVTFWYRCFPEAIFVTATISANDLSARLDHALGGLGGGVGSVGGAPRFLVAQLRSDQVQGWLPAPAWYLINNPNAPRMPVK